MNLGIVGSRRRNSSEDKEIIREQILELKPDMIVSGGCAKGADKFAEELAKEYGIPILIYYPRLKGTKNRLNVITAYYERNGKIAQRTDYLIALVSDDRKGGTENTIGWFEHWHGSEPGWKNNLKIL